MNIEIDNYLRFMLKSWATRQKLPEKTREQLLRQARQDASGEGASQEGRFQEMRFLIKLPQAEDYFDPGEWFKMWGTFSPAHLCVLRIDTSLRLFS